MTQSHQVLDYLVGKLHVKRIEMHQETGICQNSLGVVLKRLSDENIITKKDDGWYETNQYSLATYIGNLSDLKNAINHVKQQ